MYMGCMKNWRLTRRRLSWGSSQQELRELVRIFEPPYVPSHDQGRGPVLVPYPAEAEFGIQGPATHFLILPSVPVNANENVCKS